MDKLPGAGDRLSVQVQGSQTKHVKALLGEFIFYQIFESVIIERVLKPFFVDFILIFFFKVLKVFSFSQYYNIIIHFKESYKMYYKYCEYDKC